MIGGKRDYRSEVLRYLLRYVEANEYPPTYDEIRDFVGLSSRSHVDYYLVVLEGEGLIERTPHSPRSLRLLSVASSSPGAEQGGGSADRLSQGWTTQQSERLNT